MKSAAIILAAGLSSRMGAFKPLLDVGGVSALERCITQARKHSDITYVVTGHRRDELKSTIDRLGALEVHNPRYEEGMFTSIREGVISAKEAGVSGAMLWPCDCPLIDASIAKALLDFAQMEPECFHVACCSGKKGHPLFIPQCLFDEIIAHDGTEGLRPVVRRHDDLMRRHDFDTDAVLNDMDTPEGYERILRALDSEEIDPALFEGRRFWLLRHGETVQHDAPIFIGKTDVALSDLGHAQAKIAALNLKNEELKISTVYTSPLSRAFESAMILSFELSSGVEIVESFLELDLGDWDGERIDSIKERFEDEYNRRGSEICVYRTPRGENYYDLRCRVSKGLKKI
ncbi:MAG: NTP transferase domain-containing protein, partial [Oscillospiraceae bacterium]|nr:NTP transferase domain-containing protein [Oscillospiraceae bacterium]